MFTVRQLLKKCDPEEDVDSDRLKDRGDSGDADRAKPDKTSAHTKAKHADKDVKDK